MNSEKVKELKKALECCSTLMNIQKTSEEQDEACQECPYGINNRCSWELDSDALTLITDLENRLEVERIVLKERSAKLEKAEHDRDRYSRRITDLESENKKLMKLQARGGYRVAELGIENQQLKDRINELESENERLKGEKQKVLEYMKTDSFAKLKKEDMYWGYQMGIGMLEYEIDRQKDRIAELENGIAQSMLGCEFLPECTNEKLKQFAERLDEKMFSMYGASFLIDETLKEFIGEKEND